MLETVETNLGKTKMLQRGSLFGTIIRKQTSLYLKGGIKNNLVVLKVTKVFFAEVVKLSSVVSIERFPPFPPSNGTPYNCERSS